SERSRIFLWICSAVHTPKRLTRLVFPGDARPPGFDLMEPPKLPIRTSRPIHGIEGDRDDAWFVCRRLARRRLGHCARSGNLIVGDGMKNGPSRSEQRTGNKPKNTA